MVPNCVGLNGKLHDGILLVSLPMLPQNLGEERALPIAVVETFEPEKASRLQPTRDRAVISCAL